MFKAYYPYTGREDYSTYNIEEIEKQLCRESDNPVVYYSLITSANAVIRSAQCRDELQDAWNVSYFGVEAAGLIDNFLYIVIRGICNYSDNYKYKLWQPYSAVVAAVYTKDLLRVIYPEDVETTKAAVEVIKKYKFI